MKSLPRSLILLLAAAAACRPTPPEQGAAPPADPRVVAVYHDGQVTAADLDRAVLELPAAQRRPAAEQSQAAWYEGLVRELVADRILEEEAELAGSGEDPEVVAARQESRRQAMMETYLERNPPAVEEIEEGDVRRYYAQHSERYDRPGRRLVSHLFKRRQGASPADLKQQVAALRQRIAAGESFGTLAAEHSDSESRHRQGSLGWVAREQLAPELAEVIFSLPEGVPSEPLTTAEGVHLFQVEKAIEAKRFSFGEVAGMIGRQLHLERGRQAVERLAAELPLPAGSLVAEPEELAALLAAGDPAASVLRVGDYQLTVARFRSLLAQSRQQLTAGQPPAADLAPRLLAGLERRERIYRRALAQGLAEDPAVVERLERLERRVLLSGLRQRGLRRRLGGQPERLQRFYQDNKRRFSSPLRLEVRRLTVPVTAASAHRVMTRLEQVAGGPGAASERLAAAAAELGGAIEELGGRTLGDLARLHPRWPALAAGLAAGELSAPLSAESAVEMLEVRARHEPEPLPFATVLERVRAAYLENRPQELYREWLDETLAAAGLEVFFERLEGLAGGTTPAGEAAPVP